MTLSESLGQKCHPVSHAAPLKRNTPTPFTFLSLSPSQTGVVEKKKRMGGDPICVKSTQFATPILFALRISWTIVELWSKHDPICAMSVGLVKVLCVFFLSLVQTRSHLCHVGSVYSSHLVAKRGASSKNESVFTMLGSVIVFCVCVFFKPRESKIPSVPCRFSVFLPSCLLHASRGQAWRPRARTNQSFPCRFSQSVVCVSVNPQASTNSSMPCRFNVLPPSCLLHASRGQA